MASSELEQWKPIEGYPDYRISSFGRVISLKGEIPRILKPRKGRDGYLKVALSHDSKCNYNCKIHRLIGLAFIPNPQNKPELNHIDGNKFNNHISNLEWATTSENQKHAIKTGLLTPFKAKITAEQTIEIFIKSNSGQTIHSLSKEYNLNAGAIRHIKTGKNWSRYTKPIAASLGLLNNHSPITA